MNREILFRGKRTDNGEWVEGAFYAYYNFERTIVQILTDRTNGIPDAYEVDPATVGQFTGEKDRYGNRIFEGDILEVAEGRYDSVSFSHGCFWMDHALMFGEFSYGVDRYKVVGNIHDHPLLL